jgi:hypothetical protein
MKLCPYFVHFHRFWVTVTRGDIHKNLLSDCQFYRNWCNERQLWGKSGTRSQHFSIFKFHENWHRESLTFLGGINDLAFMQVL